MGRTPIEWTGPNGRVWNPLAGCDPASPGCLNCYAARLTSGRLRHLPMYQGLAVNGEFTGEIRLAPDRLRDPLRWRTAGLTFVNSMSDLFHPRVPDEYIAAVWVTMQWTSAWWRTHKPRQTFLVLTKRHGRLRGWTARWGIAQQRTEWIRAARDQGWCDDHDVAEAPFMPRVPDNIWLGVSVEDQERADQRIPYLIDTPAAVRWVSAEPLIGPVDLARTDKDALVDGGIGWVVAGGESGTGARPMEPDWLDALHRQTTAAGVPFFAKQAGTVLAKRWGCADPHGRDPDQWPVPYPREWPSSTTTVGASA